MQKADDLVVYGSAGVCRIVGAETREVGGKTSEYLVLRPVQNGSATVYVPKDCDALVKKMKSVLSVADVLELIHSIPKIETVWIDNDNERRSTYRDIVSRADRSELLSLIKTLYLHREKQHAVGKKLRVTDERYLSEAEKILHGEFSFVLGIKREDLETFIKDELNLA